MKLSEQCVISRISSVKLSSSALPRHTLHLSRPVKVCGVIVTYFLNFFTIHIIHACSVYHLKCFDDNYNKKHVENPVIVFYNRCSVSHLNTNKT